jgi:hypothetical protein
VAEPELAGAADVRGKYCESLWVPYILEVDDQWRVPRANQLLCDPLLVGRQSLNLGLSKTSR